MDKRYQVFISSTFQDLQHARQEVSQALLRADCFPAGMELFPAANEEQFEYIKRVIEESDYYILISAGRYGSLHPDTGLSYTEMEYDYALEVGKPVIRLLHKDPFNKLVGEFIEKEEQGREKLRQFREKLSRSSLVRFWLTPENLQSEVVFSLMDLRKTHPAIGWVRADGKASQDVLLENAELKLRVRELEGELAVSSNIGGLERAVASAIQVITTIFSDCTISELEYPVHECILRRFLTSVLPWRASSRQLKGRPKIMKIVCDDIEEPQFNCEPLSAYLRSNEDRLAAALNALAVLGLVGYSEGRWRRTGQGDRLYRYLRTRHHFAAMEPGDDEPGAP